MRCMASVDALAEVVEQHLAYHHARPNDENNPHFGYCYPPDSRDKKCTPASQ